MVGGQGLVPTQLLSWLLGHLLLDVQQELLVGEGRLLVGEGRLRSVLQEVLEEAGVG